MNKTYPSIFIFVAALDDAKKLIQAMEDEHNNYGKSNCSKGCGFYNWLKKYSYLWEKIE